MPLTLAQQTSIAALIVQEGGLSPFFTEIQALYNASAQTNALALLMPAITVTVQNWPALGAYVAAPLNVDVSQVMAAITAAAGASNATQLGPLFVALYAAVKSRPF